MAAAASLRPGAGQLTAGVNWSAGQAPRAFVDASQRLTENISLYAAANIANLKDYQTSAGVRVTW